MSTSDKSFLGEFEQMVLLAILQLGTGAYGPGISAELPGLDLEEVEIVLEGDRLTLKGEKKTELEEGDPNGGHHLRERSHGTFRRAFRLPDNVDRDAIAAGFDRGVLTITLPKLAEQTKKIEIKAH